MLAALLAVLGILFTLTLSVGFVIFALHEHHYAGKYREIVRLARAQTPTATSTGWIAIDLKGKEVQLSGKTEGEAVREYFSKTGTMKMQSIRRM